MNHVTHPLRPSRRGDFGSTATLAQVQAELAGYSDHELHAFCRASRNKRLQELVLPTEKVRPCPLPVKPNVSPGQSQDSSNSSAVGPFSGHILLQIGSSEPHLEKYVWKTVCSAHWVPLHSQSLCENACGIMQMRESAKFGLLAELLPALRGAGHRALLFSQWTSILDLVEWLMQVRTASNLGGIADVGARWSIRHLAADAAALQHEW